MNRSQIVQNFLKSKTLPDLGNLYSYSMEMQANVKQGDGTRTSGEYLGKQWNGWTDGVQVWKSFRIPYNAATEPTHNDTPLKWNFEKYIDGIGMTGWDWLNRCSRWVAFDFDAIMGHSDKHGRKCSDEELGEIQNRLKSIDWVTIRYSTSGKGRHIYVFINAVPTRNHTEHAALARAILSHLSGLVGYDFGAKVDICGGNMWIWHTKMTGTRGLQLIKAGKPLEDIPTNWRDHLNVIVGRNKKTVPAFVTREGSGQQFEDLTSKHKYIQRDSEHQRLLDWLNIHAQGCGWWDSDHNMLVTHTSILKAAHEDLRLKGSFDTNSKGTERPDINCFAFPGRNGSWSVRRYTLGVEEAGSWEQDGAGYTKCFYNADPDLASVARANGGIEDPSGGFCFAMAEDAQRAALTLGANVSIPAWMSNRKCKLLAHKSGRLTVELDLTKEDDIIKKNNELIGWLPKGKHWIKMFDVKFLKPKTKEVANYDDLLRHVVMDDPRKAIGWYIHSDVWTPEKFEHMKMMLKGQGLTTDELNAIGSNAILKPWIQVKMPFGPEYPGGRLWNRNAPQLSYLPTTDIDDLNYPTWSRVLDHCGAGLDIALQDDPWAKENGINKGGEYLKCWMASILQNPFEQLPFLFFFGDQNSGKTIFHEAFSLLVTRGVVRADTALMSQSNFNSELENAILCVIEEVDLNKSTSAHNKIKDWVTTLELPIHKKHIEAYSVKNTTHWVQCANSHNSCPIFDGDSRITMIHVSPLEHSERIVKAELLAMLRKEAADFTAALKSLEIPPSNDRLFIPMIATGMKISVQKSNQTRLEEFISDRCHYAPGQQILYAEFYDKFQEWLDPLYHGEWSKIHTGRQLSPIYPKGRGKNSAYYFIGNIAWGDAPVLTEKVPPLVLKKLGKTEYLLPADERFDETHRNGSVS